MITTLLLYICTSATMTDCQVYAEGHYTGRRGQFECLRDIEPTLDAARAEGHNYVMATCNVEHNQ